MRIVTKEALSRAGLFVQAALYLVAGVNHFWHTSLYVRIMPPHYSHPTLLVQISGLAEVLGGIGLIPKRTRRFSALGIISMLLVYMDVHVYMALHPDRFSSIPAWALLLRIPFQFLLIVWAWLYARQTKKPLEE